LTARGGNPGRSCGLGEIPQQIYDEVITPNANVAMVFSGHYHDAFTRIDGFDDNGDGVEDRQVYQMHFDYQGLPEGGQSFLRLLHFDNETAQISVRTYSPYLDVYNSADPTLESQHQDFTVPYAAFGMTPTVKTLATHAFSVDILTTTAIASFDDVESGSEVSASWNPGVGTHGWFAFSTDPYGATAYSEVRRLSVVVPKPAVPGQGPPAEVSAGVPGDGPGAGAAASANAGSNRPPMPRGPATGSATLSAAAVAAAQALADTAAAEAVESEEGSDSSGIRSADTGASETADAALDMVDSAGGLGGWGVALSALAVLAGLVLAVLTARVVRSRRH
jgi:hypothetical protein